MRFGHVAFVIALCAFAGRVEAQDTLFDSQHPVLKCTMQYPTAWKLNVVEGTTEKYNAYELVGPANGAGTYCAHITISASTMKESGYASAPEYFEAFLDKMKKLASRWDLLKRGNISYWGEAVPYLDIAYALPLPLGSAAYNWTPVKERRYAINHEGMMWTFSYTADVLDYDKYEPIFQHLMDTFFFK